MKRPRVQVVHAKPLTSPKRKNGLSPRGGKGNGCTLLHPAPASSVASVSGTHGTRLLLRSVREHGVRQSRLFAGQCVALNTTSHRVNAPRHKTLGAPGKVRAGLPRRHASKWFGTAVSRVIRWGLAHQRIP